MSDQGEPAIKETKELQPIKHDCSRGQRGDKTSFSPAAPYRPLKDSRRGVTGGLQSHSMARGDQPLNTEL